MATAPIERFWQKVNKTAYCWEWTGYITTDGAGRFRVGAKRVLPYRWLYQQINGPIQGGLFVLHHCDNRKCVNPSHLFLGTQADNMRDMVAKGRNPPANVVGHPGASNGRAILKISQVLAIRSEYKKGATQHELAKRFGISRSGICHIVMKKTWKQEHFERLEEEENGNQY